MKNFTALALVITTSSHAGYAGMGTAEGEGGGTGSLGDMVWGALIVGAIYLAWKKFF